jgi:hypothetical protein
VFWRVETAAGDPERLEHEKRKAVYRFKSRAPGRAPSIPEPQRGALHMEGGCYASICSCRIFIRLVERETPGTLLQVLFADVVTGGRNPDSVLYPFAPITGVMTGNPFAHESS